MAKGVLREVLLHKWDAALSSEPHKTPGKSAILHHCFSVCSSQRVPVLRSILEGRIFYQIVQKWHGLSLERVNCLSWEPFKQSLDHLLASELSRRFKWWKPNCLLNSFNPRRFRFMSLKGTCLGVTHFCSYSIGLSQSQRPTALAGVLRPYSVTVPKEGHQCQWAALVVTIVVHAISANTELKGKK